MSFALLLLCLPAAQESPAADEKPDVSSVELTAVREYWWSDFRGGLRVDGKPATGSHLRLVDDLNLPDNATIPIYGGGDISVTVKQTLSEKDKLLFSAEYWTHGWSGYAELTSGEQLGDQAFPAGSPVESRFHLTSLTLDAFIVHEEKPFLIGVSIPIHVTSARLRMDSPAASEKTTIRDVCWGGGLFLDVRPFPYVFAGLSVKGLTSFANAGDTGMGDFRVHAGVEWWTLRLEGGYRYVTFDLALREKDLSYVLHGPYASLSLTLRF